MRLLGWQATALRNHCRLAGETVHPRFARRLPNGMSAVGFRPAGANR